LFDLDQRGAWAGPAGGDFGFGARGLLDTPFRV